jgi:radical SAM protein with 4Fe4S-binding SPASM domain
VNSNVPMAEHVRPRRFVLQWHITERCNLRCRHCYQEDYNTPELSLDELLSIIEQFKELLGRLREETAPRPLRGHINVTGGEPFVREDFFDLLRAFADNHQEFSYAILSNGTLIDSSVARRLRDLKPEFVQVSIEGSPTTNDEVRGHEAFERTCRALENLAKEKVPATISFTAHAGNYREFLDVARVGRRLGVRRVWADRLIPWGSGSGPDCQSLSADETHEFFELMLAAKREVASTFCRTEVQMGRALQFLVGGGTPYRCLAGENLLTVQPDGDLYPCRRLPIKAGNVMESSLAELYYTSELFQGLRRHRVSEGCEECRFVKQCRGGLRCLSYAVTGDSFAADPGCWHVSGTNGRERFASVRSLPVYSRNSQAVERIS